MVCAESERNWRNGARSNSCSFSDLRSQRERDTVMPSTYGTHYRSHAVDGALVQYPLRPRLQKKIELCRTSILFILSKCKLISTSATLHRIYQNNFHKLQLDCMPPLATAWCSLTLSVSVRLANAPWTISGATSASTFFTISTNRFAYSALIV